MQCAQTHIMVLVLTRLQLSMINMAQDGTDGEFCRQNMGKCKARIDICHPGPSRCLDGSTIDADHNSFKTTSAPLLSTHCPLKQEEVQCCRSRLSRLISIISGIP